MIRGKNVSKSTLMAAWQLGRKMALAESGIRPNLRDVRHYNSYQQFRVAHRAFFESNRRFAVWDKRLQRIAEREAWWMGFRLDESVRAWDAFHAFVIVPIKEAFWRGWETQTRLEALFLARRKACLARTSADGAEVVHAADVLPELPELTRQQISEARRWDELARKLFGSAVGAGSGAKSAGGDDAWEMPDPPETGANLSTSRSSAPAQFRESLPELPGVLQVRLRKRRQPMGAA